MKRLTIFVLASILQATFVLGVGTRTVRTQSLIANARFNTPSLGHVLAPYVPLTLSWTIDNPAQVDSQDLILSTDGGATFKIKIAAHLPPQQRQLKWGTAPANATPRAKLELALHLRTGVIEKVFSDDFSISSLPQIGNQTNNAENVGSSGADANTTTAASSTADVTRGGADGGSQNVTPAFASPGSCTTAEIPILNYNMTHRTQCSSFYNGEPALAQDPTDPSRFFVVTGSFAEISSQTMWAYGSGTSTTQALNFTGLRAWGDLTVEVGADGTVYAIALASPNGGSYPDRILIFRSKDHGTTFETGVVVPGVPVGQFVDKPVIAVNPLDSETLVITFNVPFVSPGTHLAICKQAWTGTLGDPNIWGVSNPRNQYGIDLSVLVTTHPVIDPIDATNYRLFIVQSNYVYSQSEAGYAVYQYQLTTGQLAVSNASLQRIEPARVLADDGLLVGAPRWTTNSTHQAIEDALRISQGQTNFTKAAIDYCDPGAHRMYIPTMVNTTNNPHFFDGGLTSDLFLTVWQYTGSESVTTKRILPGEKEKYIACAVTDGHGRVWVNTFCIASDPNNYQNMDNQRAQPGVIAINRRTGDPGAVAYISVRLPGVVPNPGLFLGDYVYTQASFYPDPFNPGNVNGVGSRVASPTYTDTLWPPCSSRDFRIEVSGWN